MHNFVCLNNQLIDAKDAAISAISAAALYGKGVFTTLAIYNQKPFLWDKHWRRLQRDAEKIGVAFSEVSEKHVTDSVFKLIEKTAITNARARITIFDESSGAIWDYETGKKTGCLIMTADFRPFSENPRLTFSPFLVNSTSPLAGVKSSNYLENVLAFQDAKAKKFDEAIRLNERGEIVSACLANIFWTKNNEVYTPSSETGGLRGTTAGFISENFAVKEIKAESAELFEADDVFLTSAGIGIVRAARLERKIYGDPSKVYAKLSGIYELYRKEF